MASLSTRRNAAQQIVLPTTADGGEALSKNFAWIDAVQGGVKDRTDTPPGSPSEGDLYILTGTPTGAWSAQAANDVAMYYNSGWLFFTPPSGEAGLRLYVIDEAQDYRWDGSAWGIVAAGGMSDLIDDTTPQLGGNLDVNGFNVGGVTPTELGYVSGVTSDIQTQIDGKAATSHTHTASDITDFDTEVSNNPTVASALQDVVDDTTPQLGGNLDLNSFDIVIPTSTDAAIENAAGQGFINFRGSINRLALGGTATSLIEFNDDLDIQNNDITNVGNLGIGTSSPLAPLHIDTTGTDDSLLITNDDATADAAPVITLKRDSASPADGDYLGQIKFKGENDASQEIVYAKITGKISDVTDTTEDGLIETMVKAGGSNLIVSRQTHTYLKLINGIGLQVDGFVGIGTTSPSEPLHVAGNAIFDTEVEITGNLSIGTTPDSNYLLYASDLTQGGALFEGASNAIIINDANDYTGFGTADFTTYNGSNFTQFGTAAGHTAVFTGGNVGIGTTSPNGTLHVQTASTGATPNAAADDLVIENNAANTGITLLSGTANFCNIYFGDSADVDRGRINYNHATDSMAFRTNTNDAITIDSSQNVGIGTASPDDPLHVYAGSGAPAVGQTDIRIETEAFDNTDQGTGIVWEADGQTYAQIRTSADNPSSGQLMFETDISGASSGWTAGLSVWDGFVGVGPGFGGSAAPLARLHVYENDSGSSVEMLRLDWQSPSPADNDYIQQTIYGSTDIGAQHQYGEQRWTFNDVTDGTEDATYQLYLSYAGILRQQLKLDANGGGTELNHDGPNIPIGLLVHSKNSTDTDETEGMLIEHHRGGAVGGAGLGARYSISLENSSGSTHAAGGMGIRWTDATDTSEDSEFFVKLYEAGAETEAMSINSSGNMTTAGTVTTGGSGTGQSTIAAGLVVNDDGGGAATDDFRAETNNEANALVVDASADQVNLGVVLKLPYLGAAPSTLENGMIWMESDGLHIYYAGTERVVAGI